MKGQDDFHASRWEIDRERDAMVIYLSEESDEIVRSLVAAGRYATDGAVIDEALRLLGEREERAKLEALRRELAQAIEEADRGDFVPFDPEAILAEVRARRASVAGQS